MIFYNALSKHFYELDKAQIIAKTFQRIITGTGYSHGTCIQKKAINLKPFSVTSWSETFSCPIHKGTFF